MTTSVLDMLNILLVILLLTVFIIFNITGNIFFNYIRIKIKVIGLDIEIKGKEKSTLSGKDKC